MGVWMNKGVVVNVYTLIYFSLFSIPLRPQMFIHETPIRIRYAETDQMGVVYHGNYASYLDMARTEAMRSFGITYKEIEDGGIMMQVLDLQVSYKSPAFYDDVIIIRTIIKQMPEVRCHFEFEILREDKIIGTAKAILVCVDAQTRRPVRCPKILIDKLTPFL